MLGVVINKKICRDDRFKLCMAKNVRESKNFSCLFLFTGLCYPDEDKCSCELADISTLLEHITFLSDTVILGKILQL